MRIRDTVGIAGKRVAVNGLGPAGLIALQMMLAEGAAEVVGVDPNGSRRRLAFDLGASQAVDPGGEGSEGSEVLPLRGRDGAVQLSIDCVGYPDAVRFIMDRTNEAVALFAVQRDEYLLFHRGLTVIGYPGHSREAAEYALKLIVDGNLDTSLLISHELSIEDYDKGVELLARQEAVKIGFVFQQ
jgi:threonine dehydrogenase-like Zn-dependent dehydrogenase